MKSVTPRLAAIALGAGVLLGPLAAPALAHERRQVGSLQFVVGWAGEPTFTGSLNGVQVRITDTSVTPPAPVTDVGDALKVEVSFADQKEGPLALESVFDSPGEYQAALIPSRSGVYAFRFVGTVKGQAVDEVFTSSDSTFESPEEAEAIEFPAKDPTRAELGDRIERLDPRLTAAAKTADDAKGSAGLATGLAIAGLVVGLAGAGLAVTARRGSRG